MPASAPACVLNGGPRPVLPGRGSSAECGQISPTTPRSAYDEQVEQFVGWSVEQGLGIGEPGGDPLGVLLGQYGAQSAPQFAVHQRFGLRPAPGMPDRDA